MTLPKHITYFSVDAVEDQDNGGRPLACELNQGSWSGTQSYDFAHNAYMGSGQAEPFRFHNFLNIVNYLPHTVFKKFFAEHFPGVKTYPYNIFNHHALYWTLAAMQVGMPAALGRALTYPVSPTIYFENNLTRKKRARIQSLAPKVVVADDQALACAYYSKAHCQALMDPEIFPKSALFFRHEVTAHRLEETFRPDKTVLIKDPTGFKGSRIGTYTPETRIESTPMGGRVFPFVAQQFINAKTLTFEQGDYRSFIRSYVVAWVDEKDKFHTHILGHIRKIADYPTHIDSDYARLANLRYYRSSEMSEELKKILNHPSHMKLTEDEKGAMEEFILKRLAPNIERLMVTPCPVLARDAIAAARRRGDVNAEKLMRDWRHYDFEADDDREAAAYIACEWPSVPYWLNLGPQNLIQMAI